MERGREREKASFIFASGALCVDVPYTLARAPGRFPCAGLLGHAAHVLVDSARTASRVVGPALPFIVRLAGAHCPSSIFLESKIQKRKCMRAECPLAVRASISYPPSAFALGPHFVHPPACDGMNSVIGGRMGVGPAWAEDDGCPEYFGRWCVEVCGA